MMPALYLSRAGSIVFVACTDWTSYLRIYPPISFSFQSLRSWKPAHNIPSRVSRLSAIRRNCSIIIDTRVSPAFPVQLTQMLSAWSEGDTSALEKLAPVVYQELHRLAARNMGAERPGHILQPSALVNEAFLRLMSGSETQDWKNRNHFFAFSARLMRQILVDYARSQSAAKRGNRVVHVDLAVADEQGIHPKPHNFMDLDAALDELAALHERQARIVELRYFGGLDNREIGEVLGVSEDTVGRDWRIARAWLYQRLRNAGTAAQAD